MSWFVFGLMMAEGIGARTAARTLNVEDQYGIKKGKPASFLVLDAGSPFEAVRQHPDPSYAIALDLFRKAK